MRRLLMLTVVALMTAGGATGASADKVATSPGTVLALARSQFSVAWLSAPAKGHCGPTVHLWTVFNSGTYNLGPSEGVCDGLSGVTDVAVAGNRVAWLAYGGRNPRRWQLFTATPTSPSGQQIAVAASGADSKDTPIVLG